MLDYVNKYFPDILPESVLRHYGYDSRPEGKIGSSALYQDRTDTEDLESNRYLLATPSPLVSITKKINGTYYVVVAVPDSQKKIMHIKSAFIEKQVKKTEDNQESDAEAPDFTSETNLDISSKKNIPQSSQKSNTSSQKNQDRDYLSAVERGDMETAQRMVDEAAKSAGTARFRTML